MIRVDDIIDSTMRPFEDVREQALTAYQNQQRSDALRSKAMELTQPSFATAKACKPLRDELGDAADISQTGLVRTNPPQFLGPQVTVGLFEGRVGDVVRGPGPDQMTQQIARLESITASQDGLSRHLSGVCCRSRPPPPSATISKTPIRARLSKKIRFNLTRTRSVRSWV